MMNEKNFKKMNDNELDTVAGGTIGQTSDDSDLLYAYGLLGDYHGVVHTMLHWKSDSAAVDEGWRKAGITCVTKFGDELDNKYFLNGKEIKRDEAINHLKTNFKQVRAIP